MNATRLIAALLLWSFALPAAAQTPLVDGAFTPRSADNDPDLVVVRERFDPATNQQSLYLRLHDGARDFQSMSGELLLTGATVAEVLWRADDLAAADARWGLPGLDYSAGGAARGLEGDPSANRPARGEVLDLLDVSPQRVRFWFGSRADIDEVRVIVQYPPTLGNTRFSVRLYHARRPDPAGLPLSTDGGIQIGALFDIVPDDGDYSEVFEVEDVKLRVEDVDIVERSLDLGQVEEGGGLAGPRQFLVDNDFGGVDHDQDNGFDLNGVITPIPTSGAVEQLRWTTEGLESETFVGDVIAPEHVRVEGLPTSLARGSRAPVQVAVDVPAETPIGVYRGRVTVYEDNSLDGVLGRDEPNDSVIVTVVVGTPPDGGIDLGPPDLGLPDAAIDLGVDAEADGGPDAAPDSGADASGDATTDGGDPGAPDLGGDLRDGTAGPEAGAPFDLGSPRGGALGCAAAESPGWPWPLVLAALAWPALRRRWRP